MSEPMILLNSMVWSTEQGVTQLAAGRLVMETEDQLSIIANGGQLWPSSDPAVSAAANYVTRARLNRGIDDALATQIMMLAVTRSLKDRPVPGYGV